MKLALLYPAALLALSVAPFSLAADDLVIVVEAEAATRLVSADIIDRTDASGGKAIRWREKESASGRAEFEVTLPAAGTWYLWLRTQATDHLNNGLFVELDGQRLRAEDGHPMAPADIVYLRKHEKLYSWKPEWQGPGHGHHAGPIAIAVAQPGRHTLALVSRGQERPVIDKFALSRAIVPGFLKDGEHVGAVRRAPLPGQIVVHPRNPSRFGRMRADGQVEDVMLCGLGSPEGFLYLPAAQQDEIMNQMIRHGGNMLYAMAVRTHGGDGGPKENPFVDNDPAKGLDERILQQWAGIFRRAEQAGLYVYFLIYDDGAVPFGGAFSDTVSASEAALFQGLVRRFVEHPNLIWCVAEEYHDALTPARASALASIMADNDPHQRPIAVHQATGDTSFDFVGDPHVKVFSQQTRAASPDLLHAEVLAAVRHVEGRAIVHMAENWNNRTRDLKEKNDHPGRISQGDRTGVRQRNWAVVMAGATCQVLGPWEVSSGDKPATPEMLADMRRLVTFFNGVPLHELSSHDHLAYGDTLWLMASTDGTKAVGYAVEARGALELRLRTGRYAVRWMDCASGATVESQADVAKGTLALPRPAGIGAECAVFVQRLP